MVQAFSQTFQFTGNVGGGKYDSRFLTGVNAPAAPVITAAAVNSTTIRITLSSYSGNTTSFRLQQSPASAGSWTTVASGLLVADFPYSVSGLTASTNYDFRLIATNASGDSPASATANATTSASTSPGYTPLKLASFDSGTVGQLASGATGFDHPQSGVAGQPLYSTSIAGPFGGGKVAKMAWSAANQSTFGGDLFRGTQTINDGDELWVRQYLYLVPTFSWAYGSNSPGDGWGGTKWLRQFFGTVIDPPGNDNCFQMHNTGGGRAWGMTREGYAGGLNMQFDISSVPDVPQGQWVCQEYYIGFNSNPLLGKIRYWQDGMFIQEVIGQTKPSGTQIMNRILHGDYWNGLSPQAQTWYLDEIIITVVRPDAIDAGGRPYIGTARKVSDFS